MKQAENALKIQSHLQFLLDSHNCDEEEDDPSAQSLSVLQTTTANRLMLKLAKRNRPTVFLLDTDGTTMPFSCVDRLFMEMEKDMTEFIHKNFPKNEKLYAIVEKATLICPELHEAFYAPNMDASRVCVIFTKHIHERMISGDGKPRYYAELEDLVMAEPTISHKVQGHIFHDAAVAIKEWGKNGQNQTFVALYGSRAAAAERVLFRNSIYGDLTPFIFAFFEPKNVGSKLDASSYNKIRSILQKTLPDTSRGFNIIYITDNSNEAVSAGISGSVNLTFLALRPLNKPLAQSTLYALDVATISSFDQLRGGSVSYSSLCAEANSSQRRR
ncbi:hypothetical protein LSM04_006171 [Trypanosoma melophagium]|uniref:uncharacterized protein n=1 Tax=Trypanosoma melophagium TaxID=715481 RepID=UPI00351A503F|nr:hypothetical protein LSM04_006171 [Trypanosoma melophagium]